MATTRTCVYCSGVCDNRTHRKSERLPDVQFDGGHVLKNRWIHLDCLAKRHANKHKRDATMRAVERAAEAVLVRVWDNIQHAENG